MDQANANADAGALSFRGPGRWLEWCDRPGGAGDFVDVSERSAPMASTRTGGRMKPTDQSRTESIGSCAAFRIVKMRPS